MRALCLRVLKWGSGKQRKIARKEERGKKLGRNFMVLARRTEMFW